MSAGERIARAVPVVARGWWQDPTDPPRGVAVALEAAGMLADPTPAEVERRVREQVAREIEAVVMRSAACPGERDGRCLGLMAAARIARGLPGLPAECGAAQPPSTAGAPVPPAELGPEQPPEPEEWRPRSWWDFLPAPEPEPLYGLRLPPLDDPSASDATTWGEGPRYVDLHDDAAGGA